jgi:hypothetical protein
VMDSFFNKNDRRASDRFHANTMVQYFIKRHSMRYMDCELVDVSASGIAITISSPASEDIASGSDISLEISVTGSLDQLTVSGRINRVQRGERLFVAIKFDVPLAQDVIDRLILK